VQEDRRLTNIQCMHEERFMICFRYWMIYDFMFALMVFCSVSRSLFPRPSVIACPAVHLVTLFICSISLVHDEQPHNPASIYGSATKTNQPSDLPKSVNTFTPLINHVKLDYITAENERLGGRGFRFGFW
jgi:hypothetical protein